MHPRYIWGISITFEAQKMKQARFLWVMILLLLTVCYCWAQESDSLRTNRSITNLRTDTVSDQLSSSSQNNNSVETDSANAIISPDSETSDAAATLISGSTPEVTKNVLKEALSNNRFIKPDQPAHFFIQQFRDRSNSKDIFFYIMCGILLVLGLFKTFYNHYFSTLFTVYFNTSLRQTQLSEQLLQARLPSFILNIFFVLIGGLFVWLLFSNTRYEPNNTGYYIFQIFIPLLGLIYLIKYSFLKFLGWISGLKEVTDHYIFIIFLVNKLLAIVLIPFVILMAFGKKEWMSIYITLALLCVGLLFLSRYIKSYGLLRQKFPMSFFHFLIFFLGAELIPLFVIFKIVNEYIIA